jgi:hypothetical protein
VSFSFKNIFGVFIIILRLEFATQKAKHVNQTVVWIENDEMLICMTGTPLSPVSAQSPSDPNFLSQKSGLKLTAEE